MRQKRRRRYERNRNGAGAVRGISGFTVRHVRCDRCQVDYLPQHIFRMGSKFRWECGNCLDEQDGGYPVPVPSHGKYADARLRWRYADDPSTLKALGLV